MKLYIKQKALSLKDQYSISDEKGEDRALAFLRKLIRPKEDGVLQLPGMRVED